MESKIVREDQAQHLLDGLDKAYKAFARIPSKSYLRPEDRAKLRQHLETATKQAQSAIAIMQAQPGLSFELQALRRKILVLATMAEADLKGPEPR